MGRKAKNPKLEHGVSAGTDDLTESMNEEQDDMGGLASPPPTEVSGKGKGIVSSAPTEEATGMEKNIVSSAPTEEDTGKEKNLGSSVPTVEATGKDIDEAITENVVTEQLICPQPSSSKQTMEQLLFQVPVDYKTLYLEAQKKVEALTNENHGLVIKLASAVAKVEVYDQMRETFGSMKDLVIVSKLTKGSDVLAELTSQIASGQGTTSAVAPQSPPLNASIPQTTTTTGEGTTPKAGASPSKAKGAKRAKGAKGSTSAAAAASPGSSEPRRSQRNKQEAEK